jgi:hypothetical protein
MPEPEERVKKNIEWFQARESLRGGGMTVAVDEGTPASGLNIDLFKRQIKQAGVDLRRLPVRSSYVEALNECPRKFLYAVRMGLRRKGMPNRAASIGTMYHWMCEGTFQAMGLLSSGKIEGRTAGELALQYASRKLEERIGELQKHTDVSGLLPDGTPADGVRRQLEQNFDIARVMYVVGFERFFESPVLNGWVPVLVEQTIEVKSKYLPAPIRCKPDVIMMRKRAQPDKQGRTEDLMIVNHKSTGLKTGLVAAAYPFKVQSRIEQLCCEVAFPDQRVTHYLHNLIQRPTLRWPAKKYPEWSDYREACQQWYAEQAAKDEENPPLLSSLVAVRSPVLDEELYYLLSETAKACRAHPHPAKFYRMPSSCNGYQKLCEFYPLCTTGLRNWSDIIDAKFESSHREDDEEEAAGLWDFQD